MAYQYVGHGVLQFDEPPYVRHYRDDIDIPLTAGIDLHHRTDDRQKAYQMWSTMVPYSSIQIKYFFQL